MSTKSSLSIQAVDCILYNRHAWREAVALLEPKTSTSVVTLPASRTPGDPVGSIAASKATMTFVLDVVEQTISTLPEEMQQVTERKWGRLETHRAIAEGIGYSEKTVERRVERIRVIVKNALETLGEGVLPAFWSEMKSQNERLSGN